MGEPNTEVLDDPMRNIYWSHLKMMRACPQQYLWHKGHPDHDLGSGKGKRKPLPDESKDSEHHQLMGTVLSTVVEEVYDHDTGNVIWENHDGDWTDIDNILTSTLLMYGDLEQTIGELI